MLKGILSTIIFHKIEHYANHCAKEQYKNIMYWQINASHSAWASVHSPKQVHGHHHKYLPYQ